MHSRLWIHEEIVDILANDSVKKERWWWKLAGKKMLVEEEKGTNATKCIRRLNANGLNFEMLMKGLANMKELRFLHISSTYVSADQVSNWINLPNSLQFLSWYAYPCRRLPKTFQANYLVGLVMLKSRMVKLWKDGEAKPFPKLKFLKFYYSDLRTLDLSMAPNLETLILEACINLVEVDIVIPKSKGVTYT